MVWLSNVYNYKTIEMHTTFFGKKYDKFDTWTANHDKI